MSAAMTMLYKTGPKEFQAIMQQLRDPSIKILMGHLGQMFSNADDFLFDLAQKATSNLAQSNYFDAMRVLRMRRSHIESRFMEQIEEGFRIKKAESSFSERVATLSKQADSIQDFRLVDTDDMEKMVAISAMSKKAEDKFNEAIGHLETRLEWLSYKYGIPIPKDIFSPERIGMSFSKALDEADLPIESKLIVYKLFDKHVFTKLEDFYRALNNKLIDNNVLPKIKYNPKIKKEASSSPTKSSKSSGKGGEGSGGVRKPLSEELANVKDVDQALEILAQYRPSAEESHKFISPHKISTTLKEIATQVPVPNDAIVLQQNYAQQVQKNVLTSIEQSAAKDNRKVSQYDRQMIDIISSMFDFIYKNNELLDAMKTLISRLQIPYIKLALLDPEILEDESHVARVFLDRLTKQAVDVANKEDPLYKSFSELVENISLRYEDDVRIFTFALEELDRIAHDLKVQSEPQEEEVQQEVKLEAQRLLARKVVLYELKKQVDNRKIPAEYQPLVIKVWAPLMMFNYVKYGRKGKQWRESVDLLSQILMAIFIDPKDAKSMSQFGLLEESLLDKMQEKFSTSDLEAEFIKTAFEPFSKHYQALKKLWESSKERLMAATPETYPMPTEDEEYEEVEAEVVYSSSEKLAMLPSDVRAGAWFEIYTGEESAKRRLKLLTIIKESAILVFSNRAGQRVLDKDAAVFAEELSLKKSRLISDNSLFESALVSVIHNMQKS
jgi:hypothetical protein